MSEHDQFRELIEAYALGALDANERAALEAHLASGCAECAKALEEARLVVSSSRISRRRRSLRTCCALAFCAVCGRMRRQRWQRRRFPADASWRAQRSAVPMWLWAGVAALLLVSVYSTWEARKMQTDIAEMTQHESAELKERQKLEDELTDGEA